MITKYIASLFLTLALAGLAHAQVQPPIAPPKPPAPKSVPAKFKTIAPASVKAGDHIVIDASSAKGEVFFFYDEVAFPKTRATQKGNLLILSTGINGSYTINVASLEDKSKEKLEVKVTGGIDPDKPIPKPPDPPGPVDPLISLKASVDALIATVGKLDQRIGVLEQIKPIPPTPPIPTPTDPIAVAIFGAWQQEFAPDKKDTANKMAQCYRAASAATAGATSWGDLSSAIKNKAIELGISGKLPAVSKAINTQLLASGFPASPSVLLATGDDAKARGVFSKVITALETLP